LPFRFGFKILRLQKTGSERAGTSRSVSITPTLLESIRKMSEVEPWKTSKAKQLLMQDIVDGKVTREMGSMVVFNMRPEYKVYKYTCFQTNLRNLRRALDKLKNSADEAKIAYGNFIQRNPPATITSYGYPVWEKSQAQTLLRSDITSGDRSSIEHKDLWQTRQEYKIYPFQVFRDHVYTEIRRHKSRAYWSFRKSTAQR
jgi:hypothetical protein